MSILKNKYEILDEEKGKKGYTIPSVLKQDEGEVKFKDAVTISTILHPLTVGLAWLLVFILGILGINFTLFNPPAPEKKDIEFVLVDKPAPPRNPHTKNRADMNSRSGGHRDKTKPVVLPTGTGTKPTKASAASDLQKMIQKQQKEIRQEQIQQHKKAAAQKATQKAPQKSVKRTATPKPQETTRQVTKPSPKPPVARPTAAPSKRPISAPKTVAPRQTTPFAVPVPSGAPRGKYLSTGPVGGTGTKGSTARSGGYASGHGTGGARHYAPTPSLSTYSGRGTGSGSSRGGGSGSGARRGTGGYAGNPGGGGGRPGIDAIREPDFGPYMRELQRRIKYNWHPPKGNESRKVVLLFKIAKNGQLLSCRVYRSSGLPSADQAALRAVKMTAPFRPLPADYRGTNIDIQFTFDYNVFGASMR